MLSKFTDFIAREQLIPEGERVLLAVSGGVDSVVMAHLFRKARLSFGIVHCNFGLRGIDSDGDEYFVQQLAANFEVPFFSRLFDVSRNAREQGVSVQMAARQLRYDYFEEAAQKNGFPLIATAHHADDASETLFINLLRGSGIRGLHGIPLRQGRLIRPLLFATRAEIEEWAAQEQLRFREDASNRGDRYLRNRIRHQLLPLLRELEPGITNIMQDNLSRIAQAEALLREKIAELRREMISGTEDHLRISLPALRKSAHAPLLLHEFLSPYGFHEDVTGQLATRLHAQPGKCYYSPTHRLLVDREYLLLAPLSGSIPDEDEIIITKSTRTIDHPVTLRIRKAARKADFVIPNDRNTACLDADKLSFPLKIRKWKRGDVFHPLGARGRKKLSDFFSDHKFSRMDKEQCYLLCAGDQILWVIAHRIAHPVRITDKTQKMIIVTLQNQ